MSRKSSRSVERFDYKKFNDQGIKVPIVHEGLSEEIDLSNMDSLVDEETKLGYRLRRLLEEHELEYLFSASDVEAAISEMKESIERFEDIHIQLKRGLGEEEYIKLYPDFFARLKPKTDWIIQAKRVLHERKTAERAEKMASEAREFSHRELEKTSQREAEREEGKIKLRNAFLRQVRRVEDDVMSIDLSDSRFVDDIQRDILHSRQLLKELNDIDYELETAFGNDYQHEFCEISEKSRQSLNDAIKYLMAKSRKCHERDILAKEQADKEKQYEEHIAREKENNEKIAVFKSIISNVKERYDSFQSKYSVDLGSLSDSDLLKRQQDIALIDSEFSDILDWLTELAKARPTNYQEADAILSQADSARHVLRTLRNDYRSNLDAQIKQRDITEEKMKNASVLGINIPKLRDYTSAIDFYTFKSEFEKLVVPVIQAKLLPDYLKNNLLEGQALLLVKELSDLDEIWKRLEVSFGNVNILLSNKLKKIEDSDPLWKMKSEEKISHSISKIINLMKELGSLASAHGIESTLYHSSNLAKIYAVIGKKRQSDIVKKLLEANANDQVSWNEIIRYLDKELRVREQVHLFNKSQSSGNGTSSNKDSSNMNSSASALTSAEKTSSPSVVGTEKKCVLCGKTDHVPTITNHGNKVINYFACYLFVSKTTKQRFELIKKKRFCFQCLTPGLKPGHSGNCFDKYKCPHESHKGFSQGLHILICDRHKENPENIDLLKEFKSKYITFPNSPHRDFSRNLSLTCHYETDVDDEESEDMALYIFQTIRVKNDDYNLFYDGGCGAGVLMKMAVDKLVAEKRGKQTVKGPITLYGVNEQKSTCEHGKYQIALPLHDGQTARIHGICVDKITSTFPIYPLHEIEKDIHQVYQNSGADPTSLPRLPEFVGGDTHIMMGILYKKWYPVEVFRLPSGLSIYRSKFLNSDGTRGVVGGPHPIVAAVHRRLGSNYVGTRAYFTEIVRAYKDGFRLDPDVSSLSNKLNNDCRDTYEVCKTDDCNQIQVTEEVPKNFEAVESAGTELFFRCPQCRECSNCFFTGDDDECKTEGLDEVHVVKRAPKNLKIFEDVESAGTEVSYRCPKCRGCPDCLKSQKVECISVQAEVEQDMIDKSVTVDLEANCSNALLPFMSDPAKKLAPNAYLAKKVYKSVTRSLKGKETEKEVVRKAEKKLYDLGFNDYLDDLSEEEKQVIKSSPLKHFLPWRVVWNANSLTTPCRPVFDASMPTSSGLCLNDILAKGSNNMNQLLLIFLRWRMRTHAYHTDLQTMYNRVGLKREHWCYQLYYYHDSLDPDIEPRIKVNKTLTYGVKSSGNQAERAIRKTADMQKLEFPREGDVINDDTYVDDCISGEN